MISNLGAAGLFALVTGDLSDVVAASIAVLADAGYSQALELAADDYAMQHLHQQQISSIHLSNFCSGLKTLESWQSRVKR